VLGLGTSRLSISDESAEVILYAVENGINYFDLGTECEPEEYEKKTRLVGRALEDGYRNKVMLAAGVSSALVTSTDDLDRYLDRQLELLETDGIDFYLLGGLDRFTWPKMLEMGALRWLEKAIDDGLIGKPGFGFHDQYQFLREIVESYGGWSLAQFQYSYMDFDHHPGASGIRYAAGEGLGVIVTEPLRGGRLTKEPPPSVAEKWGKALEERSPAEWGLKWIWNHPEISTVVCDMSTLEQVRENLTFADSADPDSFSIQEQILVSNVRDAYRSLRPINCTACRACMPCTMDIDAPRIFEIYNDAVIYDDKETGRKLYRLERHDVSACNDCGICAERCGRKIDLPYWLKKAGELLE
jgi:predicted aldo/keto reductase-like oxidoreductase